MPLNDELPPRAKAEWARVPLVNSPREPWRSLRLAVQGYRDFLAQRRTRPEAELVAALVTACRAAVEAGQPFAMFGLRGVYECRAKLGPLLAELRRDRIRSIARQAVAEGLLLRDVRGSLMPPDAA